MSSIFPKDFKFIVLHEADLPEHDLNDVIIHCSNIDKFQTVLNKYNSFNLKIACTEHFLVDIASLLSNCSVDTLYVLTKNKEVMWPIELLQNNIQIKEIENEQQLMRNLCLDAVLLYYNQSVQHQTMGNNSLKNMCINGSLRALNCDANFV